MSRTEFEAAMSRLENPQPIGHTTIPSTGDAVKTTLSLDPYLHAATTRLLAGLTESSGRSAKLAPVLRMVLDLLSVDVDRSDQDAATRDALRGYLVARLAAR